MSRFRVSLFAYLKDKHGPEVTVESEPDVEGILEALRKLGVPTGACRLSVNREFVRAGTKVREEDEIALIPPVSGG